MASLTSVALVSTFWNELSAWRRFLTSVALASTLVLVSEHPLCRMEPTNIKEFKWILTMLLLFYLVLTLVLCVVYMYWKSRKALRELKRQGYVFYVNSNLFVTVFKLIFGMNQCVRDMIREMYNLSNKKLFGIEAVNLPLILVKDPELVGLICVKHFDCFTDRSSFVVPKGIHDIVVRVLVSLEGQKWRNMRKTLSPAFTGSKRRIMFPLFIECGKHMNTHLHQQYSEHVKQFGNSAPCPVNLTQLYTRYICDTHASSLFGLQTNSFTNPHNEFFEKVHNIELSTMKIAFQNFAPSLCKLLNLAIVPTSLLDFFVRVSNEVITFREKNGVSRPDMLQLLIDAKHGALKSETSQQNDDDVQRLGKVVKLTNEDIAAQVFGFFFAGFEANKTRIGFLIYHLALYPEIQERVYQEIKSISENNNGELQLDDLENNMKYTEMVLDETQRLFPSVPAVDRLCVRTVTLKTSDNEEITIRKGTSLQIPISGFHYDAKYFPDPEKFDPERFSPENVAKIPANTFMPFGVGPRNCIGGKLGVMEVKMFIYHLLSQFQVTAIEQTEIPVKIKTNILTTAPSKPIWIGIKPRA